MSLFRPERISNDAQAESSAPLNSGTLSLSLIFCNGYLEHTVYQHISVIKDPFSKCTKAIPTSKVHSSQMATLFLHKYVRPYKIQSNAVTKKEPQFVNKWCATLSLFLRLRKLENTAHHPYTNEQVERYSRTIVVRLSHYISEHERDRDSYVQSPMYEYNT